MTVLTTDTFAGRTVSSGFGTASDGTSVWAGTGSPYVSVSGGEGIMSTSSPTTFPADYINGITAANVEILVRLKIGASGNTLYPLLRMQSASQNSCYRCAVSASSLTIQKVVSGTTTSISSSISNPYGASVFIWVRFRAYGSNFYAKLWQDGNAEPSAWGATATDTTYSAAGNYGLGATLTTTTACNFDSLTVYNVYSLDTVAESSFLLAQKLDTRARTNFLVNQFLRTRARSTFKINASYTPAATPAYLVSQDTFIRPNQSGWGTASDGETWAFSGSVTASISADTGVLTGVTGSYNALLGNGVISSGDVTTKFIISSSSDYGGLVFSYQNSSNYCYAVASGTNLYLYKVVNGAVTLLSSATTTVTPGVAYWMHAHLSGTTAYVNVWVYSGTEPSTPMVTATDPVLGAIGQYGCRCYLAASADTVAFYQFQVTAASFPVYYVATNGSDSNPGTQSLPFATIQKAASMVTAGGTVHVAQGTYNVTAPTGYSGGVTTLAGGTPYAPITYVSDVKWGAKIVSSGYQSSPIQNTNPQQYTHSGTQYVWEQHGNYVTIQGFDLTGDGRIGVLVYGTNVTIDSCYIHDIPAYNQYPNGGSAVSFQNQSTPGTGAIYGVVRNCLVNNIGIAGKTGTLSVDDDVQGLYMASRYCQAYNNKIFSVIGWGLHAYHDPHGSVICNNLVVSPGTGGIALGSETSQDNADYVTFANNILVNCGVMYGSIYGAFYNTVPYVGTHNQYLNNVVWNTTPLWSVAGTGNADVGTLVTSPQFVNYTADINGDYHLTATSPCIGRGIYLTGVPLTDYDGVSRFNHKGVDIGPYEYAGAVTFNASFSGATPITRSLFSRSPAPYASTPNIKSVLTLTDINNNPLAPYHNAHVLVKYPNGRVARYTPLSDLATGVYTCLYPTNGAGAYTETWHLSGGASGSASYIVQNTLT